MLRTILFLILLILSSCNGLPTSIKGNFTHLHHDALANYKDGELAVNINTNIDFFNPKFSIKIWQKNKQIDTIELKKINYSFDSTGHLYLPSSETNKSFGLDIYILENHEIIKEQRALQKSCLTPGYCYGINQEKINNLTVHQWIEFGHYENCPGLQEKKVINKESTRRYLIKFIEERTSNVLATIDGRDTKPVSSILEIPNGDCNPL